MQTSLHWLMPSKKRFYYGKRILISLLILASLFSLRIWNQHLQGSQVPVAANDINYKNIDNLVKGLNSRTKSLSSHRSVTNHPQVPAVDGASLQKTNWFQTVKADLEKRSYRMSPKENATGFVSINRAQGLQADYTATHFQLQPLAGKGLTSPEWKLDMQVKGLYADGKVIGAPVRNAAGKSSDENSIGFAGEGIPFQVKYHNDNKGVRQDFIIPTKPVSGAQELRMRLQVGGDWVVNKVHDRELHFAKQNSRGGLDNKISYSDLKVWDAHGRVLPAKIETGTDNQFDLVADVRGAVYPVTIDPLSTSPSTTLGTGTGTYGFSVSSAGDVNGDGYSDVVVGDEAGNVYIYLGSASGLSSTAAATLTGSGKFGISVASAGDVNGDGIGDIIVGNAAGNAYIYEGSSPAGIANGASPSITLTGAGFFGTSVASAGDVNGDGYSDIIVGAPLGLALGSGTAYVFNSSSAAITAATVPSTLTILNDANFGFSVASAGDVNADGYADVIVGDAGGGAYIYEGSSPSGIGNGAIASISLTGTGTYFGASVSSAGDVNGDGYSDVVVGSPVLIGGGTGAAFVYTSSNATLTNTATTLTPAGSKYGIAVASAGDVNGDGYSDVLVGDDAGNVYVYQGSGTGVPSTATTTLSSSGGATVASAGDVNGDGYSDVITGSAAGNAYTYLGSPTGSVVSSTVTLNGQNIGDQFGYSVSSAGDVNGDGYDDVLVGANGYVGGLSGTNLGAFYLYLGGSSGLSTIPTGTPISGPSYDGNFALSVAGAGDVNGDGYGDIIIGGIGYNNYHGIVYIYYGTSTGINSSPDILNDPGANIYDQFGYSVASAGDVNGDGYADVVVGANGGGTNDQGAAYLYMGSAAGVVTTPINLSTNPVLSNYTYFGSSVASAGDVNGDGYSDIIVGCYHNETAYIYLGSKTGIANNAVQDIAISGDYGNKTAGSFSYSVASAGDVNGDGYSDVIVGVPGGNGTGTAAIFLGSASGTITTAATVLYGANSGDNFGINVGTAGDVNGDGYSDVIVKSEAGPVYVYQGSSTGFPATVNTTSANAIFLDGVNSEADAEFMNHLSIASAGDVNGDGYSDIISGVYETNSLTGTAYVYYGNGGLGHSSDNVLRLYNTDLTTPINAANLSQAQFGLGLNVKTPYARVYGRLVWEVEPNGVPFDGNPITYNVISTGQQVSYNSLNPGGTQLQSLVSKIPLVKANKVRARIQYAATAVTFGQVYSPWIYSQAYLLGNSPGVLPLKWISITATQTGPDVLVNWKTGQEQNSSYFEVDRSTDGLKFDSIGRVAASGNTFSTTSYHFTDNAPHSGNNIYRVKEVDVNGQYSYSPMVSVTISANAPLFMLSPNPTSDNLTITYTGIQTTQANIMDGSGKVVRQYSLTAGGNQATISLQGLPKGTYYVQLVNSGFAPKLLSVQ